MRKGLKLFGAFEKIFLEARIGTKVKNEFIKKYSCATGENGSDENAFMVRTKNGWPGAIDTKAYFAAPDWVVESLRKLGFRVVKRQIEMHKYEGGLKEYPWKVCSNELFWWLADYGYTLGENNTIPYEFYLVRKALEAMQNRKQEIIPMVRIALVEADNPVYEAQLLVA